MSPNSAKLLSYLAHHEVSQAAQALAVYSDLYLFLENYQKTHQLDEDEAELIERKLSEYGEVVSALREMINMLVRENDAVVEEYEQEQAFRKIMEGE